VSSAQGGDGARPLPGGPADEPPDEPTYQDHTVSRRVRRLVLAVWALLVAHLAATFLWAAPGYVMGLPDAEHGTGERPTAAHRALETYMTPVFAQNWSVFAPSPLHVEYTLLVRGMYPGGPEGGLVPGPWIDTTAVEVRALAGHLLPAATERPSRRLASDTRNAYLALSEEARAVVLASPECLRSQGLAEAAAADPWPGLRTALLDAGATPDAVDQYLGADRALAALATQVLRADGPAPAGHDPVYVQASVVRRAVAPYGAGERPEPTELVLGARPPVVVPGQDDAAFRATWDALRNETPPREDAR
jgi:hypothetical protein